MTTKGQITAFIDKLAANGQFTLTSRDVKAELGVSSQATSNALSRLVRDGMLDRVSNGHYAVRQIGMFGTRAAAEDVALAVGATFAGEPHRISHRSALARHGLLIHPARNIQVSVARPIQVARLSGRKLDSIIEDVRRIDVGSESAGYGAAVSALDRALLECANRPTLCGGWGTLAHAMQSRRFDQLVLESLADELDMHPALRRIASLADHLSLTERPWHVRKPKPRTPPIPLDPIDRGDEPWLDREWMVEWSESPGTLLRSLTF